MDRASGVFMILKRGPRVECRGANGWLDVGEDFPERTSASVVQKNFPGRGCAPSPENFSNENGVF